MVLIAVGVDGINSSGVKWINSNEKNQGETRRVVHKSLVDVGFYPNQSSRLDPYGSASRYIGFGKSQLELITGKLAT